VLPDESGNASLTVDGGPLVHPSYSPTVNSATDSDAVAALTLSDMALIHVTPPQPIWTIPVPVPIEMFPSPGMPLRCFGHGQSQPGAPTDEILRQGNFTLGALTTADGTSLGVPEGYVTQPASGAVMAGGDSGGPCFEAGADALSVGPLTGIHSWASTVGGGEVPTTTADAALAYGYGWIAATTSNEIENVVATYGGNLGAPAGNATDNTSVGEPTLNTPREALTGRTSEIFTVDPTWLGDPYPGQIKDFVLAWSCGRSSVINGVWAGPDSNHHLIPVSCPPSVTGIQVQFATYGQNCGAPFGNETNAMVAACDGRAACDYAIDDTKIGDPAPGCSKDFSVNFTCPGGVGGGTVSVPANATGQTINLRCAPPCQPATCASLGAHCGSASDGCGGTLDCGGCSVGVCSSNQCVCIPRTSCFGVCGTVSNGCGGTLQCPACPCVPSCSGKTCGASNGCGGKCSGLCTKKGTVCTSTSIGPVCLPPD
jgi:hypothetical protein